MKSEDLIAAGWKSIEAGGFTGMAGPFWMLDEGETRTLGLLVDEHHCNNHMGTLHGGAVMTFADIALGAGISKIVGERARSMATLSLQTQFVSVARIGDFVTCTAELVRESKQIIFVRGLIKAGDKTIASVEGMWKLLESAASKS